MKNLKRTGSVSAMILATVLLTGCFESAEEQAEAHYQTALELVAQGDTERAVVELRNVFKLNGMHHDARVEYARLAEARGDYQEAYSHYLRLVEQYPGDLTALRALTRLALLANDWTEVERHLAAAETAGVLATDLPLQAIKVNFDFRNALVANSDADRDAAAERARALVAQGPDAAFARRVVVDDLIRRADWPGALAAIEQAIAENPDDPVYYPFRLQALQQLGRTADVEAQLRDMVVRFPDDIAAQQTLVTLLLGQDRLDDAEAFLRDRAEANDADPLPRLQLVDFLTQQRGTPAALAELDAAIARDDANRNSYRAGRATLRFAGGETEAAIAEMEQVIEDTPASDDERKFKISLARMYFATDNPVGARALVEEVLKEDTANVEALKLKGGWLIDDDKPGDALVELNTALDQAPRDPMIFSLMARAHGRAGNNELVAQMLNQAVDASGNAVAESIAYADHLAAQSQLLPAEGVLLDSLRANPDDITLLGALGKLYVSLKDRPRLDNVVAALERVGTEQARAWGNELTAQMLLAEDRGGELDSFLEGLAQSGEGGLAADIAVIRRRLADGKADEALAYVDNLLAETPDSQALQFIRGGVLATTGRLDEAAAAYNALREIAPANEALWIALYRVALAKGDAAAADALLEEAIAAVPEGANLQWAKAARLEQTGDIPGAIAIYETLYQKNPGSLLLANNLASLISSYDASPDALERAYAVARRLRGTEVPALQDTYGWIAERLGNHDEALEYLAPAAEGLPDEPLVQYHHGVTLASLGRDAEALDALRRAEALLADRPEPAYLADLKAAIARLETGGAQ